MSTAIERIRSDGIVRGHVGPAQDTMGPQSGQNVPDDSVRGEELALVGADPGRLGWGLVHDRAATVGVFAVLFWLTAGITSDGFAALMLLTAALIWVSMGAYVVDAWFAARGARGATTTLHESEGGRS